MRADSSVSAGAAAPLQRPLSIAVIGAGISGLAASWLLAKRHAVTLYEKDCRLGGHANTVETPAGGVDTGFIVYNEATYPNLTALFAHLRVATRPAAMSFAVSLAGGRLEYSSASLRAFLGGGRNLLDPRFRAMCLEIARFFRLSARAAAAADETRTLGAFLDAHGFNAAFQEDFLLPQAAAIWSSSGPDMRNYPAAAFLSFFANHGLNRFLGRPQWRTVLGGSQAYVRAVREAMQAEARTQARVVAVTPEDGGVAVRDAQGGVRRFDRVLIAAHADEALAMLPHADAEQRALLGGVPYRVNAAVLHSDARFMPRRRDGWASWNVVGAGGAGEGCAVTYWMNALQGVRSAAPLFVTLNPPQEPEGVLWRGEYAHPCFTAGSLSAQRRLWDIQGRGGVWFAGAWFGAGFHEDGLQAGLAAAEDMGGVRRPWRVAGESGRLPAREAIA